MVREGEAEGAGSVQPEEEKGKLRSHHNLQRPDRRGMRQLFPEQVRVPRWDMGKSSLDRRGKENQAEGDQTLNQGCKGGCEVSKIQLGKAWNRAPWMSSTHGAGFRGSQGDAEL